ncbi:MAG: hypothetical protein HYS18_11130 [Burkholderiales bacterium]|nr:hypothetical protein [Burkholderiales bacterium]
MFTKSVKEPHFGDLSAEGQSKIWETTRDIPSLGKGFLVCVWGSKEGPTAAQCNAFGILIEKSEHIHMSAVPDIASYLNSCGVAPPSITLSPKNVWEYLAPCFAEVHSDNQYCAGEGPVGTIAISVGYEIPRDKNHLLQLGIINGKIDQVYSE